MQVPEKKFGILVLETKHGLGRLDRFFCNQNWDITFDNCSLHALSSSHSDHCPLLLSNQLGPRRSAPFKFENFWTRLPHFQEIVTQAWNTPTDHTEPFHRLGHKLRLLYVRCLRIRPRALMASRATSSIPAGKSFGMMYLQLSTPSII